MAEINIEKKKKPVWPWILLIVLIAIIGWLIYDYSSDGKLGAFEPALHTTQMVAYAKVQPLQHFAVTI